MPEDYIAPTGEQDGLPEEEFSSLLQSVSAMAPLLKGFFPPGGGREKGLDEGHRPPPPHHHGGRDYCARREALLFALKPYLSPARCAAIDYLIRLARVGDAIRALQ